MREGPLFQLWECQTCNHRPEFNSNGICFFVPHTMDYMGGADMRYRDISGKEIVDIAHGSRLGILGQTDLEIDLNTGKIESFILPNYKWFGLKKEGDDIKIRWSAIKRIGDDMIMIEE